MRRHSYQQAEKFILSREFFGMKLGLENISEFLREMGNPQRTFPTIHVGGTNGKGSTVAMLTAIFRQAGYRTGQYTSPHLVDFRERIQVNGELIPRHAVARFVDRYRTALVKKKSRSLSW